jgi:hypothetical protein
VIALAIAQAAAYARFLSNGKASIGLVPTLALQELWLMYALISSTIPCLQAFVGAFTTNGLVIAGQTTIQVSRQGNSNSIPLSSLRTNRSGASRAGVSNKKAVWPDPGLYDVGVTHGANMRAADRGDGQSIASDGSQQMIIRRDTQIDVHSEARPSHETSPGGSGFAISRRA